MTNALSRALEKSMAPPREHPCLRCECCGEEIGAFDEIFIDRAGTKIGCSHCVRRVEAIDMMYGDESNE